MHGYPVMQFVQYSVGPPPAPPCTWLPQPDSRIPASAMAMAHRSGSHSIKKYVVWCLICGGFSCLLGALFLGVYFLLHSYTITVGNFETVPTFVPATLLILTGLCIMSLARRRNRYSYLIKLSGACGLISALTCALVTVTTTVLHMSRLQALRECEYAQKTRTCTCYSDMIESQVDRVDKEGVRLVFDSLSDCGVVHGSLYSCLRAIFGLSVAGVLIAVFSCMLVYQLLSHERKKMYWEQLELRCRSLYSSHQQQQQHQSAAGHSIAAIAGVGARGAPVCRCCEQCHAHRQLQLQATSYPWVDDTGESRFWAGQPPGNFYSPNPGGDDTHGTHAHVGPTSRNRLTTGWSWPRMPWQRSSTDTSSRFRQIPSSPDSQYGFSSTNPSLGMTVNNVTAATTAEEEAAAAAAAVAAAAATQRAAQAYSIVTGSSALPYGVWGPPPPYSDPNSPARRGYYQYIQPASNCNSNRITETGCDEVLQQRPLSLTTLPNDPSSHSGICASPRAFEHALQRHCNVGQIENVYKSKEPGGGASLSNEYGNTCSDSDVDGTNTRRGDRFSNTLPTRKIKKRIVDGTGSVAKCIGSRQQAVSHRVNIQRVFPSSSNSASENDGDANGNGRSLNTASNGPKTNNNNNNSKENNISVHAAGNHRGPAQKMITSHHGLRHDGVENTAFLNTNECAPASSGVAITVAPATCDTAYEDPTESEIYFADVSSCCNMSMQNDNYYGDSNRKMHQHNVHQASQRAQTKQHYHHQQQQQHQQQNNCSHSGNPSSCCCSVKEGYAPSFRQRENSIRTRQTYTQLRLDDNYKKKINIVSPKATGVSDMATDVTQQLNLDNKNEPGIPKDISLHSMCSNESEAKTECTDLSPVTPCSNQIPMQAIFPSNVNNTPMPNAAGLSNFIASYPYSSESKFHEAHRRYTRKMHDNLLTLTAAAATPQESHYEVINDDGCGNNGGSNSLSLMVTTAAMSPRIHRRQQHAKNSNMTCGSNKMPINRTTHSRSGKSKDNLEAVWSSSDASGSSHHRQRL